MTSTFIPLGYHCNVTMLTEQLKIKKETCLFEWLDGNRLQYLTDVVNSIKVNIDTNIIKGHDKNLYILNEGLVTYHYGINEYKTIFERRANRFLEKIKESSEIIFIRVNPINSNQTSVDEINKFCQSIWSINSNLKITFLLINTVNKEEDNSNLCKEQLLENINLIQKFFLLEDCNGDIYLKENPKLCVIFYGFLLEAGYIPTETCSKIFCDRD